MSRNVIIAISLYGVFAWFGLHGAACNVHKLAVENYWAHGGTPNTYNWSHAYCSAVGAPLRWLLGQH